MSQKEALRLEVIRRVQEQGLAQGQAAQLLGLSVRQVKRLCRRVRQQGAQGLVWRRRGRPSNRRVAAPQREHYLGLVRQHYADFGPLLAHEYLQREHGFAWSVETLRGWMVRGGLWQPKRRRAERVHSPRARRECLGELVQIDGSHHDWFEGRSSKCCLTAFIDDATGRVLGAQFFEQETTQGYLSVLNGLVQRHGAPLALYSDRHGIFTKHDPEDAKPTRFERALLQLNIEPICAHSPQAKGRVERLLQTLQDRMCKAMRLAGIDTIEQANSWLGEYLREHNRRFAVAPHGAQDMPPCVDRLGAGAGRHLLAAPPAPAQRPRRLQVRGRHPATAAQPSACTQGARHARHCPTRRRHAAPVLLRPIAGFSQLCRERASPGRPARRQQNHQHQSRQAARRRARAAATARR